MDPELADQLMTADGNNVDIMGGKQSVGTVLFSDVRSFTTITEELGAQGTVKLLNDYFTIIKGPDTTQPQIALTEAGDPTSVTVTYSEKVDQGTAETLANYAIDNGVTISAAAISGDQRSVVLTTSPLTEGIEHTLTVNNVEDLAGNVNSTQANSLDIQVDSQAPQRPTLDLQATSTATRRRCCRLWIPSNPSSEAVWWFLATWPAVRPTSSSGSARI